MSNVVNNHVLAIVVTLGTISVYSSYEVPDLRRKTHLYKSHSVPWSGPNDETACHYRGSALTLDELGGISSYPWIIQGNASIEWLYLIATGALPVGIGTHVNLFHCQQYHNISRIITRTPPGVRFSIAGAANARKAVATV